MPFGLDRQFFMVERRCDSSLPSHFQFVLAFFKVGSIVLLPFSALLSKSERERDEGRRANYVFVWDLIDREAEVAAVPTVFLWFLLRGFTMTRIANPWKTYVKLSPVLMGSHGLTKGSLAFLNYPAQLMFKSTKVLPVMVMGAFIPGLRCKYPGHKYISALILVTDLILFTLADAQTSLNFSVIGVAMVSNALIMDSIVGNLQKAIFTMNPETIQVMLYAIVCVDGGFCTHFFKGHQDTIDRQRNPRFTYFMEVFRVDFSFWRHYWPSHISDNSRVA